jgi:hypothetical protein
LAVHFAGASLGPSLRDALGDALWAAMMMWLLGAVAPRASLFVRGAVAYAISACVEVSQLYHAPALDAVRETRIGHLFLGSGFDPRDLLWYALGIVGALLLELTARARADHFPLGASRRMAASERMLYHQIHPLKLFTDVSTAAIACYLLWEHRLGLALAVGFVPSIVVSAALITWADLEPYRRSPFGGYVGSFMTRRVEIARFAGLIPLWGGAWTRRVGLIALGVAWIIGCWLWGFRRTFSKEP